MNAPDTMSKRVQSTGALAANSGKSIAANEGESAR
jgi:hypothetical protein